MDKEKMKAKLEVSSAVQDYSSQTAIISSSGMTLKPTFNNIEPIVLPKKKPARHTIMTESMRTVRESLE